jgi:hypothetical protein
LVKAKIAASVLTEFESPPDAIGVAADALVVSRVGEMLKETLSEWRNVRAESVVNPSAFLAGLDKASVAQKRQVSERGGLRRLKRVAQLANASSWSRNAATTRKRVGSANALANATAAFIYRCIPICYGDVNGVATVTDSAI